MRSREGMKSAVSGHGQATGKPKLSLKQENHLLELHTAGDQTTGELAELFSIDRSTVYRPPSTVYPGN